MRRTLIGRTAFAFLKFRRRAFLEQHIRARSVLFFLCCPVWFRASISKLKSTRLKLIYICFTITDTPVVYGAVQLVIRRLPDPFGQVNSKFSDLKVRPELPTAYVHVVPRCPVARCPYPRSIIAWFTKSRVRLYCQVMFDCLLEFHPNALSSVNRLRQVRHTWFSQVHIYVD